MIRQVLFWTCNQAKNAGIPRKSYGVIIDNKLE